jgi:hypothetical protein
MPADKILFPRRMIYIEAVLYLLIAAAAFGVGYVMGRGGGPRPVVKESGDRAAGKGVPVEGRITFSSTRDSTPQPDPGAVVIALPKGKQPKNPLSPVGYRVDDPPVGKGSPAMTALDSLGGAMDRTDKDGRFTLFVPQSGWYYIIIISQRGERVLGDALERKDLQDLGKYFEPPEELLMRNRYKWIERNAVPQMEQVNVDFMG